MCGLRVFSHFGHKSGIDFGHFGHKQGMVSSLKWDVFLEEAIFSGHK